MANRSQALISGFDRPRLVVRHALNLFVLSSAYDMSPCRCGANRETVLTLGMFFVAFYMQRGSNERKMAAA